MRRANSSPAFQWLITGICFTAALLLTGMRRRSRPGTGPVYRIRPKGCSALALLGFAADLLAIPLILRAKPVISSGELSAAAAARVPLPDRLALRQSFSRKEAFEHTSDQVLRGIIALFALLALDARSRRDFWPLFALYAEMHAITYTLYSFGPAGPAFQDKYRPVVYYKDQPEEARNAGNNRNACYSGHTGNAAAATFFLATVYADHHPERSPAGLYGLACLPPLLLGYLRVKALKHFPTDVTMAIAVGALCGIAVPAAYRGTDR